MSSALERGHTLNPQAVKQAKYCIHLRIEELEAKAAKREIAPKERREYRRMTGKEVD